MQFKRIGPLRHRKALVSVCVAFAFAAIVGGVQIFSKHSAKPKYSRQDCLVRIDVIFPKLSGMKALRDSPIAITTYLAHETSRKELPIVGFSHPPEGSKVYVQFKDRCDEKRQLTASLANAFMREHPAHAWLIVSDDVIKPGWDTTVHGGPWWTDGYVQPPGRPPRKQ